MSQTSHDPGLKMLIQGKSGVGKTTMIAQFLKHTDMDVFLVMTEPAQATIRKALDELGITDEQRKRLHINYCPAGAVGFASLKDRAKKINTMSFQALASLGDIDKQKYNQFYLLLDTLSNFVDQATGESFGPVDEFDENKVLFIDSLSGINIMAMDLVAGGKPAKNVSDWGIAQDNIKRLIQQLCMGCRCWVGLTAHVEPERDEVTGKIELMTATLGRKLAPEIPYFFDEVLYAYRDGKDFYVSTEEDKIVVKNRAFPSGSKIKFAETLAKVYEAWK